MPKPFECQKHSIFVSKWGSMGAVHVEKFVFNAFQENTYVVDDGSVCVIIDPGCYSREEQAQLFNYIDEKELKPVALLLTHAHIDHVLGCHSVLNNYSIDFICHKKAVDTLRAVQSYAAVYGFPAYTEASLPTLFVDEGEVLTFGDISMKVMHTPGHSVGHVVYYLENEGILINGDVLFAGSFGRVDLPGGNMDELKHSIIDRLFKLPENTIVYSGHGGETTIGREKTSNYILQF